MTMLAILDYFTVCPGISDPFYIVTYYIKWVTTSLTHSNSEYEYSVIFVEAFVYFESSCSFVSCKAASRSH